MLDVNASNVFNILHIDVEYEFFHILLEFKTNETNRVCTVRWYLLVSSENTPISVYISAYTVKLEYINSNNDPNDATISMHSKLRINKYTLSLI